MPVIDIVISDLLKQCMTCLKYNRQPKEGEVEAGLVSHGFDSADCVQAWKDWNNEPRPREPLPQFYRRKRGG